MPRALQLLAFAAALTGATYVVIGHPIGVNQAVAWLPTGVAVAGLWHLGPRAAWVVFVFTATNRVLVDYPFYFALAGGAGSTIEALVGVALLRSLRFDAAFERLRDVAALFACAVAAPVASIVVSWAGRLLLVDWREAPFYSGWGGWWRMNALGIVTVLPLALAWRRSPGGDRRGAVPAMLLLVASSTGVLAAVMFGLPPSPTSIVLLYAVLPIALLGALRLGPIGAIVPATAGAVLVAAVTSFGHGPFTIVALADRHAPLQIFLLTVLTVPLVIGSLIAEREAGVQAQRRLEDRLQQAEKMDAIGKLAGGVAHDFNNLLTVITGCAEALEARLGADDVRRQDAVGIQQAAERASGLVRQLLAFSRRQVLIPQVVDLGLVVQELGPMLRRLLGDRIRLVTTTRGGPNRVRVDRVQIEQVLINLAVNARDAMPVGGTLEIGTGPVRLPLGEPRVDAELPAGDYIEIVVRDEGVGMDERVLARACEPFFTTKDPARGTGLGLSTVYGIVQQSGGALRLETELGKGTCVRVFLPASAEATAARAAAAAVGSAHGAATILIVEDEPLVRDIVARNLRGAGYSVIAAEDGPAAQAVATAQHGRLDLLVTDVVMPGMSGPDLAARLVAEMSDLSVLFVSGYSSDQQLRQLRANQAFLAKPFSANELLEAVQQLLGARAATR